MIEWLLVRYGKITAADLQENKRRLNEPLDSNQPVSIYFKKIEEAAQYANDGNDPFSDNDIIETAYYAFQQISATMQRMETLSRRPKDLDGV